jgi:hypothetical protein
MNRPAKQRILFLDYTNGIGLGGGQRSLQLLFEELDRNRFELMLACPEGEEILDRIPSGVQVYPIEVPAPFRSLSRRGGGWPDLPAALPGLARIRTGWRALLRNARPDLIHANNMKMLFLASLAAPWSKFRGSGNARYSPRTSVTQVLSAGARGNRVLRRVEGCCARTAANLAGGDTLQRGPAAHAVGARRTPPRVPPPPPPEAWGVRRRLCRTPGQRKGARRTSGRLLPLHTAHPHLELLLAGQGPMQGIHRLRRRSGRLGAEGPLHGISNGYAGRLERHGHRCRALHRARLVPRSAVEAMAYGLPVVGADSGGICESIAAGETGFLVPSGDASALVNALALLAAMRVAPRARRIGRRRCERLFSAEEQARRLECIYDEVLRSA